MGKADLHTHTNASDGDLSPEELIEKVSKKNLEVIAITDHDTINGYLDAKKFADEKEIELITGVEISTVWNEREIHVLAYGFDEENTNFLSLIANQKQARRKRMKAIVDVLKKEGIDIDYAEVRAESHPGNIGRPHAASVLINKGYVASVSEAFIRYLSNDKIKQIKTEYAVLEDVLSVVHEAGGILSIAHPGPMYSKNEMINLLKHPFDGIECIHPSHSYKVQKMYLDLAKSRNLLVTGGSDFHGSGKSEYDPYLGVVTIGMQFVEALKRSARSRKNMIVQ
ncbi:PHP domain-containing protein [Rhodohalobacter sulfatireducens]|uniref:PHP domain-containing protein n=1 Tax=Rhodohalobacter sulfatireducens TaxID=2911366 RepID=A0ABS9KEB2_9BACT|nr:PHP domain-containing protein [Rhodohalobacter sulfatireducens]MCG2589171.1 PHP domain-containing protein [Rhodohalobacter sulfatireducens]